MPLDTVVQVVELEPQAQAKGITVHLIYAGITVNGGVSTEPLVFQPSGECSQIHTQRGGAAA